MNRQRSTPVHLFLARFLGVVGVIALLVALGAFEKSQPVPWFIVGGGLIAVVLSFFWMRRSRS